jgi:23S rRNA (cytidine1920-2'-O)/16S rRNA (cytidine1409-2'-O)-methyltransferase
MESAMKPKAGRARLDVLLVERGFAETTRKALAMILSGEVRVDGNQVDKAGMPVSEDATIEVSSRAQKFVSRGGIKLAGALQDFAIDPSGCACVDLGASNGGFTDCLLQRGAIRVYAVDVNTEQLDWKLRQDPRVVRIEQNARDLRPGDISEAAGIVVIDVSFISVSKVIAPAISIAAPTARFLILIKPQFELSREEIPPGGVVTDEKLHEKAIEAVREAVESAGLHCLGVRPSRLLGAEGNQEYFLYARKKSLE